MELTADILSMILGVLTCLFMCLAFFYFLQDRRNIQNRIDKSMYVFDEKIDDMINNDYDNKNCILDIFMIVHKLEKQLGEMSHGSGKTIPRSIGTDQD